MDRHEDKVTEATYHITHVTASVGVGNNSDGQLTKFLVKLKLNFN